MAVTMFSIAQVNLPPKSVRGEIVGKYFGISPTKYGWKITHLPTGYALTDAGFASRDDAYYLCVLIENVFENDLKSTDRECLAIASTLSLEKSRYYRFIKKLNELALNRSIITSDHLQELADGFARASS